MKLVAAILLGVVAGMITMYYMLRPQIGNKYSIDADIKNKKGEMTDNIFKGELSLKNDTKQKKGLLKRLLTKKK